MGDNDQLVDSWMAEFRNAHEDDPRNATRQPFDDYWRWVKVFFVTGGVGQRGWLDQGDDVLHDIRDAATAEDLRRRLHAIGKVIAAEWAKDNRYRRIFTTILQGSPNLRDWGARLQRAAARDTGDGAAIGLALDAIEQDLRTALGG